jgi:hypothetical protein
MAGEIEPPRSAVADETSASGNSFAAIVEGSAPRLTRSSGSGKPRRGGFLRRFATRMGWSTLLTVALPLLAAFLYLRFYGLPGPAQSYLMRAIEARHVFPYPFTVRRFLLDPTGAILADQVTVYRDANRQSVLLQVNQIRIGIAWFSWWRGRGIINGASISDAEVRYPIGNETADFHEVNADIAVDDRTIKIENAQACFFNFFLSLRGTVHNEGFPRQPPPTQDQLRQREALWRSVASAMRDLGGERPIDIQLDFESATQHLSSSRANFIIEGNHLTWRGAPVEELSIHGSLHDDTVDLSDFKVAAPRGDLSAYGEWNIQKHTAQLQFTSSMDFTTFAPAFSGAAGAALSKLDFPNVAPSMSGRILFDLRQGMHTDLQADLDWRDFTFNQRPFSRLSVPLAYDGKRLLIPGLKIVGDAGNVDLELFFDRTQTPANLNARITSTLDPTVLKGVLGAGMDRFLESCAFPGGGPNLQATAKGTALKTDAWTINGKLAVGKFVYKKAVFSSATSDFTFSDSRLSLPNLEVVRPEGKGGGGIIYDFGNRSVILHNLVTQVNVSEVAPVMGPKFTEYTKPYHFARPPLVHANGKVDLQDQKKDLDTDLLVQVEAKTPMDWTLFHVPYSFDNPNGTLTFKNRKMTVDMKQCGFYGGSLTGTLDMDLRQNPAGYVLDMNLDKVDFKKFMVRTFNYAQSTGVLNAATHLSGAISNLATMDGRGEVKVSDGDITAIPLLGSLTPQIPLFSVADAAHSHFTVEKGVIHTDDLHISSETLALIGNGTYNFITDQVDLNMRVNANLIFAIPLYPLSKIFEFHGTGPMKGVKWTPKNL